MYYRFSRTSEARLLTCDYRWQKIMRLAIQRSVIDFGIACGHRSDAEQQAVYAAGKSEKDGVVNKSKHQTNPSIAIDVYAWVNGKENWELVYMAYLAGLFRSIAIELGYSIRWGANWDNDGELLTDQKFQDTGHHELI